MSDNPTPLPDKIRGIDRMVIDAIESGRSKGDVTIFDEDGNVVEQPVYSLIPHEECPFDESDFALFG